MSVSDREMEHMSLRAAEIADGKARRREERRVKILTLISAGLLAVFTAAGYTAMQSVISVNVEESVRNETEELKNSMERELKYQQLVTLSLFLEAENAFRPTIRIAPYLYLKESRWIRFFLVELGLWA